jgi:hypothetical protein
VPDNVNNVGVPSKTGFSCAPFQNQREGGSFHQARTGFWLFLDHLNQLAVNRPQMMLRRYKFFRIVQY